MKINLLPEKEIIKSLDKKDIAKKFICGILSAIALAALANLYFGIQLKVNQDKLKTLEEKAEDYIMLQKAKKTITEEMDALSKEFFVITGFSQQNFSWYDKLVQLANLLPEEVWFNRIDINAKGNTETLSIQGYLYTLDIKERPISVFNRFVKAIKANQSFYGDFSSFSVGTLKTVKKDNKELLSFNIDFSTE